MTVQSHKVLASLAKGADRGYTISNSSGQFLASLCEGGGPAGLEGENLAVI